MESITLIEGFDRKGLAVVAQQQWWCSPSGPAGQWSAYHQADPCPRRAYGLLSNQENDERQWRKSSMEDWVLGGTALGCTVADVGIRYSALQHFPCAGTGATTRSKT